MSYTKLSASETTPVPSWLTLDRDGNIVEVGEIGVVTDVDFKDLLGVFYGEMYTTKSIGTNESLLFEGAISFDSSVSFTGKLLSVFYTILVEGESYTWPYFERGFTLNPDSIQSNFSGLIDSFYKQLAVVDHQSYFVAPNASRTAIQSLKTFLYNANETHQTQLSSQVAKSNHAELAYLELLSLVLLFVIYCMWRSYFRKKK